MTRSSEPDWALDLFLQTRIGAQGASGEAVVTARRARPAGPGVRIDAYGDGEALSFWVPEADWCGWLAPHWPAPALAALDRTMWPLAAGWTLTVLDGLLSAAGLAPCAAARPMPAEAPAARHWCLLCQSETRRLPLFVLAAPEAWLRGVLAALAPDEAAWLSLPLGLGWCPAPATLAVGDGLAIAGAGEELDQFWLHPAATPGRLRLIAPDLAEIGAAATTPPALPGAWTVEVAALRAPAAALWPWRPGEAVAVEVAPYPLARLASGGGVMAQGELLRLTDGWAVRIAHLPSVCGALPSASAPYASAHPES
ncbi:MAG: hypothetical protein JO171_15340 [Paludibacterium sp.]|uniref:hypothetical protein n=1 Tax=Paludibacterium sp. TaxID=1917523 RepID=UPI0025FC53B7|nr:hypothetical protein [Paludibacterium sp.]MBV8048523.1 hypothetical protein [Paludibacterium sp.]MBV8646348.1 hypothetical protein [Paludibacterium sp.]